MSEPSAVDAPAGIKPRESLRTITILIYALYLVAFFNGITAVAGVIIAYIKRDEAKSTIYESHYANIIETFWLSLLLAVIGAVTAPIGIGFLILLGLFVFYLYRTLKGIIRAVENEPYA